MGVSVKHGPFFFYIGCWLLEFGNHSKETNPLYSAGFGGNAPPQLHDQID